MKAWYYFTRQHCAWCCKGPASNKGLCLICLKYYYIHKSKFTDVFTSFKQNSHLWDCSCVYLSPIFDTLDTFVRDFNWALAVNPRVYRTGKGGSCPMWLQIFPKYGCRGTMQMLKYMHTCGNAMCPWRMVRTASTFGRTPNSAIDAVLLHSTPSILDQSCVHFRILSTYCYSWIIAYLVVQYITRCFLSLWPRVPILITMRVHSMSSFRSHLVHSHVDKARSAFLIFYMEVQECSRWKTMWETPRRLWFSLFFLSSIPDYN